MSKPARAPSPVSSDSGSSSASASEREEERQVKRRKVTFEQNDALGQAAVAAFVPPQGLKKVAAEESLDEFDYDKLKQKLANGCELWAIRIPDGLKLRHLSDVQLAKPGSSTQTQTLSKFTAKKADYEVLSLGSDSSSGGAGELQALTPLLGSKSSKKYTTAPVQIARHLVVRRDFAIPPEKINTTSLQQDDDAEEMQSTHVQPEDLRGFFAPAGYSTPPVTTDSARQSRKKTPRKDADNGIAGEAALQTSVATTSPSKDASKSEKKEKKKKRKSEAK